MSDLMNENNNENNNGSNSDHNKEFGGFAQAVEFCKKHVLHLSVAGLFVVLVIVIMAVLGGDGEKKDPVGTETVLMETEKTTEPENYEKDVYPEINTLVSNYYNAYANGDNDTLATIAEPISDTEKSYITALSQHVEGYENIACYTKSGLDENSYVVSVYMEIKFVGVETTAPGLDTFYVRKRDDGSFYIDNLYGQFNSKMDEFEVDADVASLIDSFSQQEDVVELRTQVQQKYEEAIASDENLKTIVGTTLDEITVWASDQAAAAKKAEEEKAAAEEAARKAAEEEAAKKAEEEKRAAELAAAVTVYATDKVNVRAQASETADIIGQLEAGSQTTRLEDKDGWSRIDYSNGTQGYVKSEYLSTTGAQANEAPAVTPEENAGPASSNGLAEGAVITLKESVNVRKAMGEDAEKIATAFAGEKVTVIMSYAEGWTKVTYAGQTGFIKTSLLQ